MLKRDDTGEDAAPFIVLEEEEVLVLALLMILVVAVRAGGLSVFAATSR